MADIFGGTQPPAWLVEETRQTPGLLGDVAGQGMAAILNAVQRDPNATQGTSFLESRKGIAEGISEARLNAADPLWKIKLTASMAQQQAVTLGRVAQAQSQIALANERKEETSAWMQDAPKLSPWLSATPEQRRDMPEPIANSKAGITAIQRSRDADTRYFSQKDAQQLREANSKIQQENVKRSLDWQNAVGAADPDTQAQIAELPNQGWVVDGQGRKISPSVGALGILNEWRKANNLLPFGAKQAEVQKPDAIAVEKEKQKGRESLEGMREKGKEAYEKQRQQDRMDIEEFRSKSKMDIEKMKLSDRDSKTGKIVTEDEFVNRHLNKLFDGLYKETSNPKQSMVDAEKALRALYRSQHKSEPVKAAPAPAAPATETKPAPAAAPAANEKDPLGILK